MRPTLDQTSGSWPRAGVLTGTLWGLFAILIWSGWMVVTRLDILSSGLNLYDITAIRFATAALVLAPVALRHGILARSVGLPGTLLLAAGSGAPYALIAGLGLTFAPASHAGPLMPGVMPLFAAALSVLFLGEHIARSRVLGLCLIPFGVALVAGLTLVEATGTVWVGDLLFITAAFFWASYTVTLRRSGLAALQGAALVATWSALLYLPVYLLLLPKQIGTAAWPAIAQQVVVQGILTSVVSLIAFNRAVAILGASRTAVLASLVPALAALLAVPVLGEVPRWPEIAGIGLVTLGVLLGSGAMRVAPRRSPPRATQGLPG